MTICPDCLSAATKQHHGFTSSCRGCAARAVSRTQEAYIARRSGRQTSAYRTLLEQSGLSHEEVKSAAAADSLGRGSA